MAYPHHTHNIHSVLKREKERGKGQWRLRADGRSEQKVDIIAGLDVESVYGGRGRQETGGRAGRQAGSGRAADGRWT